MRPYEPGEEVELRGYGDRRHVVKVIGARHGAEAGDQPELLVQFPNTAREWVPRDLVARPEVKQPGWRERLLKFLFG